MKIANRIGFGLAVFCAAMQLIPVDRSNPPATGEMEDSSPVKAIVRRACFDCHSNETIWPWYSRIAPVSWLIAHDVSEGRAHLNFSHWQELPEDNRQRLKEEIVEVTVSGEMPPWFYLLGHAEARLTEDERDALKLWAME